MATEQRCINGHFYNPAKFSSCPHCGVSGIDIGETVAASAAAGYNAPVGATVGPTVPLSPTVPVAAEVTPTVPLDRSRNTSAEKATVAWYASKSDAKEEGPVDPVVGWLVCIEGPDRGRDFRIKAEKNFIGRSTAMDICIAGDERVSRENHAIIAYEPRHSEFRLYPGDARGLVYLNEKLVDTPTALQANDVIELGNSRLMFVPLCGERFKWAEK